MPALTALVVTHNRIDHLRRTLARFLASPPLILERMLVVDVASTDGTQAWLQQPIDPRLETLRLPHNAGGAGGFVAGMSHLCRDCGRGGWAVLSDDDGYPAPGALEAFCATDRTAFDAWYSAVRYPDGAICEINRPWHNPCRSPRIWLRTALMGRAGYHISDMAYANRAQPRAVDGGSFVGMFVSLDALRRTPLPDAKMFLYGDDAMFALALGRSGYRAAFDPQLAFEHDCRATHPDRGSVTPAWRLYFLYRNRLRVYRAATKPVMFWLLLPWLLSKWWLTMVARHPFGRSVQSVLFRAALCDALFTGRTRTLAQVQELVDRYL